MATVASHDFTASPLENPARLIATYCGSCTLPNTPSPIATSAPRTTATSTATPLEDLVGVAVVGACASDIAIPLHASRICRHGRRRCGGAVGLPLHAGHAAALV